MRSNNKSNYATSLFLIGTLFFIFGFITWLNGTLIPFLKTVCQLNNSQASLVTFAFFISYFIMAIPSSAILKKTGFKNGMSLGLAIMATGCLLFIPAAMQRNYLLFLSGLFVQGLGLSILQTASNPYVTIIGPIESAAKRISLMGICNKAAGFLSPIILGSILLANMDSLQSEINGDNSNDAILTELSHRIINPYIVLTIVLLIVAVFIRFSPLPDVTDNDSETGEVPDTSRRSLGSHTYLFLGAIAIFMYVGVEVLAGDYIIAYGRAQGMSFEYAKYLTSLTLACMVGGYLLGVLLTPNIISQEMMLKICLSVSLFLVCGVLFSTESTNIPFISFHDGSFTTSEVMVPKSVLMLSLLGFTHAIMWAAIWPMSIKDLGRHTKLGSALLIMGIAGGAIIPLIYGSLTDVTGNMRFSFWIMIPCYLYMLFFAIWGHKIGWRKRTL